MKHFIAFDTLSKCNINYVLSTDTFSCHYFLQVAECIHIEYDNRQVIFLAHAGCGEVHHLQTAAQDFVIGNIVKLGCRGVFFRVAV